MFFLVFFYVFLGYVRLTLLLKRRGGGVSALQEKHEITPILQIIPRLWGRLMGVQVITKTIYFSMSLTNTN